MALAEYDSCNTVRLGAVKADLSYSMASTMRKEVQREDRRVRLWLITTSHRQGSYAST